jgi:hypothetical protein
MYDLIMMRRETMKDKVNSENKNEHFLFIRVKPSWLSFKTVYM